jgi:hypothetical protein
MKKENEIFTEQLYKEFLRKHKAIKDTDEWLPEPIASAYAGCSRPTLSKWRMKLRIPVRYPQLKGYFWYPVWGLEKIKLRREYQSIINRYRKLCKVDENQKS